ncbi:unnamed protein product, partial [Protopolystoma xenopodis]
VNGPLSRKAIDWTDDHASGVDAISRDQLDWPCHANPGLCCSEPLQRGNGICNLAHPPAGDDGPPPSLDDNQKTGSYTAGSCGSDSGSIGASSDSGGSSGHNSSTNTSTDNSSTYAFSSLDSDCLAWLRLSVRDVTKPVGAWEEANRPMRALAHIEALPRAQLANWIDVFNTNMLGLRMNFVSSRPFWLPYSSSLISVLTWLAATVAPIALFIRSYEGQDGVASILVNLPRQGRRGEITQSFDIKLLRGWTSLVSLMGCVIRLADDVGETSGTPLSPYSDAGN